MMREVAKRLLAENLQQIIAEKGWERESRAQLAKRFNHFLIESNQCVLSEHAIDSWIHGRHLPRWYWFVRLGEWLDCELTDLLPTHLHELLQAHDCE